MVDQALLLMSLAKLAQILPTLHHLEDVLPDLTESVVSVLGISGSGVTLAKDGTLQMTTALAGPFEELERVQVASPSGPCHEAFTTGQVVSVDDMSTRLRQWPEYTRVALDADVHAVAGIPVTAGSHVIGVLNLYNKKSRAWSSDELATARVLADLASSYFVNISKLQQLQQLTEQLQHAFNSRLVVEQAKGVIAQYRTISVEEAFERIRHHARHHQVTVRAVADAILNAGLRP